MIRSVALHTTVLTFGLASASAACTPAGGAKIELPRVEGARAMVVGASGLDDSPPMALALDPLLAAPTLPTLEDEDAEVGVFTALYYDAPLDALRLEPGRLAMATVGPDVGPLPEPRAAFERLAEGDDAWDERSNLEGTALRASRVGVRQACPRFELDWRPLDGVPGYVQASTWLDDDTLLLATDSLKLLRFDVTRGEAVALRAAPMLVGALFTTRSGRVFAATASTALVMELTFDGEDVTLEPLPGLRVDPAEPMAGLAGPPLGAPEVDDVLYAVARSGRLLRATVSPPSVRQLDFLGLVGETGGGDFKWVAPRRYLGYSSRALGRVFTIDADVVTSKQLSLGAFGAAIDHPTLGAVLFSGLQAWAIRSTVDDAQPLAALPEALVSADAAAPTPWGFVVAGDAAFISAYLSVEDFACAATNTPSAVSRLVALPDGDVLAFTREAPAGERPLSWSRLRPRLP